MLDSDDEASGAMLQSSLAAEHKALTGVWVQCSKDTILAILISVSVYVCERELNVTEVPCTAFLLNAPIIRSGA